MGSFARVVLALTMAAGALTSLASGQPVPPAPAGPPCATCLAIVLQPEQLELLPGALNGLEILVDVGPPVSGGAGLLQPIVARGGRGGLRLRTLAPLPPVSELSAASTVVLDVRAATLPLDALVFALRTAATSIRAVAAKPLRIAVDAPAALRAQLAMLTPQGYWDAVIDAGGARDLRSGGVLTSALSALAATQSGPGAILLSAGPDEAQSRAALADLALAARWLDDSLVPDDGAVRVRCGESPRIAVYRDPISLDRLAVVASCHPDWPVVTEPALPVERAQLSSGAALVRIAEPAADRFTTAAEVTGSRRLTVEEIVARHQAAAARQATAVRTLMSSGTLTVTFEAPGFPAPVTVASSTTIYAEAGRTDLEQRDIRVNGVAFRQHGTPKLPIIEPERVAAPPLSITLGDRYRYRLDGEETVAGVRAYVVRFEPVDARTSSFRGQAWIASDDFGVARISARQTTLRGPVVSSEQTDEFARVQPGTWVLARSEVHQLYEGAAYRTPIHRVLALGTHDVNAADFQARRQAAYASDHTIVRDTPAGYRYIEGVARETATAPAGATRPARPADALPGGTSSSRVRTLAFGVIVDPNISQPLPFAGLSYLDFNLFGTGTQFNGFFGGSYGQLAFSVPSLRGTGWQAAGRAFGIASSYNDRAFVSGREEYDRNIRQRPAAASAWLVRPLTTRLALRVGYDLEYTALARSEVTAAEFVTPSDQVAHGLRLELNGQRAGWEGSLWWVGSRRVGWRPWGRPGSEDYRPADADFQRYGASIARSVVISPRLVARVEASAMGGHDLDRFSRFAFGTFDNRLRGYPSALIRYDGGAVGRGVLGWAPGRFMRLDGFADTAVVHDPGFSSGVSRFTGVGAALEAPAPFGTLVAIEWGYGVQGVNADGSRGTHVVRISGYKVF